MSDTPTNLAGAEDYQVNPDEVAALIRANTTSAPQPQPAPEQPAEQPDGKPGPKVVQLNPGLAPVVEELKSQQPAFEPEPNLAYTPRYPPILQGGVFKKFGDALQEAEVTKAEREEYLRALMANRKVFQEASHRWTVSLAGGKLPVVVRSLNGYEESMIEEILRDAVRANDNALPPNLYNLEVCCVVVLMIELYGGAEPFWTHMHLDPAHFSVAEKRAADKEALKRAVDDLMAATTPAHRKACAAAIQMFEAKSLKCQAGIFDPDVF